MGVHRAIVAGALLAGMCCLMPAAWGQTVTMAGLLDELTNLEALSNVASPSFTCRQFSSYDRRSTDPAAPTDENWFANNDRGQYLREEERNGAKEYVLMDAEGPGAIVRFWSANPVDAGVVRVYIDGAETPTLEAPLDAWLSGTHELAPAPIGHEVSKGWNSYLPLPYATHCKVTASLPNFYYHINYRTYAAGTTVEPFSVEKARAMMEKISLAAQKLAAPSKAAVFPEGAQSQRITLPVEPGSATPGFLLQGQAGIYELSCRIEAPNVEQALRQCVLSITFDGEASPSVLTPLGDFFGMAPGYSAFEGLPCGADADGRLYAHWVMPFRESAVVTVLNHGKEKASVTLGCISAPRAWTDRSLYFKAKWRAERDIPTRPKRDWNFIETKGRGNYVGNMLHVTNPVPQWWGEGDEKIYVDGEAFPSHFGTGSEDYYGYAWCWPGVFTHAYHNQPRCDGPGNLGQTCVNRFHILDVIPFTSAFRFDLEVWHSRECVIHQSAVTYWYADAAASDNFPPLRAEDLTLPDYPRPEKIKGALEGEKMRVVSCSKGKAGTQTDMSFGWSNAAQLWWRDAQPGDTLEVAFWAPKAGKAEVLAALTRAPDYAIVNIYINGTKIIENEDLYAPEVTAEKARSLGAHILRGGENMLKFEIVGMNEKSPAPRHMVGLDYVTLGRAR